MRSPQKNINIEPQNLESLNRGILEALRGLQSSLCAPFIVSQKSKINLFNNAEKRRTNKLPQLYLDNEYSLKDLLSNKGWIEQSIRTIASHATKKDQSNSSAETALGLAFSKKYAEILNEDDARHIVLNWDVEIERAKSHLPPKAMSGDILHIGTDLQYEPKALHGRANSITLIDISEKLLQAAVQFINPVKSVLTKAESLTGIGNNTIDLYAAFRVYNSVNFGQKKAIQEAKRVLRKGGSIFLSVSNGYKAIDNTILPGQIIGKTPKLSLSLPFQQALEILSILHDEGFHELFLVPASAELFFGGTLSPSNSDEKNDPILHTEAVNNIPLSFYSEKMPTSWLGNYSNHSIRIHEILWPTVEHFFQASKFREDHHVNSILNLRSPDLVKRYAWKNQGDVRKDWMDVRMNIMKEGLLAKFTQYTELKKALEETRERELIERSNDPFWGRSLSDSGLNVLGNLLCIIRKELK